MKLRPKLDQYQDQDKNQTNYTLNLYLNHKQNKSRTKVSLPSLRLILAKLSLLKSNLHQGL